MLNACYILHRRAYRETSLLLDVFSYQHGKVSLLAKGAYKAKSARSAHLQPFQPLLMEWLGRSSLKTLTSVEAPRPALRFTGINLYAAMYVNELLFKLLQEEQPMHQLFESYIAVLDVLSSGVEPDQALRIFESRLLGSLGLMPDLKYDWQGNRLDSSATYYLSTDGEFVLVPQASFQTASETFLVVRGADAQWLARMSNPSDSFSVSGINSINEVAQDPDDNATVKAFLRSLIDKALDGREIESRKLVKQFVEHSKV